MTANPALLPPTTNQENGPQVPSLERIANTMRAREMGFALSGALWIDERGGIIHADNAARRLLAAANDEERSGDVRRSVDAPRAGTLLDLELGLSRDVWQERLRRLADAPFRFFTRLTRADGAVLEVEVAASSHDVAGRGCVLQLLRDVRREQALKKAYDELQARFELTMRAADCGLWVWDLVTGEVEYSPRWCVLMGLSEARLVGTIDMWLEHIHPADRQSVDEGLGFHLDGLSEVFESEHRVEHRSGIWRWIMVRALAERNAEGNLVRVAGSAADITHRKNAEERLRYEAFHDPLTGLANRAWFIHRLRDILQQTKGKGGEMEGSSEELPNLQPRGAVDQGHYAVALVGVDGFKLVNDSFGPSLGDMLLRAIAARIARSVRSADTVARVSGDEFALLLEGLETPEQVGIVADRIVNDLARPFDLRGYAVYTSVSMGIVPGPETYGEPEEVLRDANIALMRAKKSGRAKRVVFDQSMRAETIRRLLLETDLRRALERAELHIAYQPVISLQTGEVVGLEALCRWHHNKHGLIGPSEFIPLAEESGLIFPIGRWALQVACEDIQHWCPAGGGAVGPWVAVNVSGRQLAHPDFVEIVREVLVDSGMPPGRLHLEITESVLMENAEASREVLVALRDLGVGLSIDDFGTGYSSLAYLRRFPIETLKIDRAFLAKGADAEDSWKIIETIRSLAEVLGLQVIVEGVETLEHALRLRELGCEAAQGFLFAHPFSPEEVVRYLAEVGDRVVIEDL